MKKSSFQFKMIFYQIIVIVVVMFLITGFFYQYLITTITDQSTKDFDTISSKSINQLESLCYEMDQTALQVAANPSIVKAFQKVDQRETDNFFIKEPTISNEIVKLLNSYNFKKNGCTRICLYNNYKDFVCTATAATTITGISAFFESNKYNQIKDYFQKDERFVLYIPPQKDLLNDSGVSEKEVFSVIREMKDYSSNSSQCGYVEVQEAVEKLDVIFDDMGEDCNVLIFDNQNRNVYKRAETNSYIKILESDGKKGKIPIGTHLKGNSFYSFHVLNKIPYSIIIEKQNDAVMKPLYTFQQWLLIGVSLCILTAILTEILLVRRLSRPLLVLRNSINHMDMEQFRLEIDDENNDELQQLEKAFNSMLKQLKETMKKQHMAETNELKSHLFALQSQMNPHFLYNILAIISMEAENDQNYKIQNICSKLCRILTFTSSMGDGFSTIEEEIKNAENYMILMKERYEELFEYEIQIEESVKNLRIPKLIVQPICENCFAHAFKNCEPIWRIQVTAFIRENKWLIQIKDNGSGFSEEFLREIQNMKESITLDNVKEKLETMKIGGLCVPNIYMRLKISYEQLIFDLYNDENGAVVLLGGEVKSEDDKSVDCGR